MPNEPDDAAASGEDGAAENESVDLSLEAIEKRMAERGHATTEDGDDAEAPPSPPSEASDDDAGEEDATETAAAEAKPEPEPTKDEKKSWQAKQKAEVEAAAAKVRAAEERASAAEAKDSEWVQAANETLLELRSVQAENAALKAQLKAAGIEEDPTAARVRELEQELAKYKGTQGLKEQLAKQQADAKARADAVAAAQQTRDTTFREASELQAKYPELKDRAFAEEVFGVWQAACAHAESRGKAPPAMTAFVQKQVAAARLSRAPTNKTEATRRGTTPPPRTLSGNGSSAVPTKFPATDEGIEAWAKSRGYEP